MTNVASLNSELFHFIDKFPRAAVEAIDFFYKSSYDSFVDTLRARERQTIAIIAPSEVELEKLLPRFLLISDLLVFNISTYSSQPKPMLLPVPDDLASPVLGIHAITDSDSKQPRVPTPAEMYYIVVLMHARGAAGENGSDFLGFEWGRQGFEWRRTSYSRTSQPYKNDVGEDCHIAVGAGLPYAAHTYEWLLQQARPLLEGGYITFAPFLRVPPEKWGDPESIHKAHFIHADVGTTSVRLESDKTRLRALLELEIPYFDGIPLPLLAKVLDDEKESFLAFRASLLRLIKSIEKIKDEGELLREIEDIRRNHVEPELAKLEGMIKRTSKMRALRATGCLIGSSVICLMSAMGIPPPSLLLPAAGGVAANLLELVKRVEEEQKLRENDMYFLWHLKKLKGT